MANSSKKKIIGSREGFPLKDSPVTRPYVVEGEYSKFELTVNVLPNGWILYEPRWITRPPTGYISEVVGQLTLYRQHIKYPLQKVEARQLPKIRAVSSGVFYCPKTAGYVPGMLIRSYDAAGVSEFDFHGELTEKPN